MKLRMLKFALGLTATLAFGAAIAAEEPKMTPEQQAMMEAWTKAGTPGPEHKNLEAFVGNWKTKSSMWMDPAAPPETSEGTATYSTYFGGRYLREDYKGTYHGEPFEGLAHMGYDNVTKKYWVSWNDSMATALFVSTGDYDAAKKTYTMRGTMNDPTANGAAVPIRTVTRFVDADRHVFEWYETRDGKEIKSMEIEYVRSK